MARRGDALLIEHDELLRDLADRSPYLRLRRAELLAAETVQRRRLAAVGTDGVDLVARHVELVVAPELEQQVVALGAADGPFHHAGEPADAVDVVHHVVAGLEVIEEGLGLAATLRSGLAMGPSTPGDVGLGQHGQLDARQDEAPLDRLDDDLQAGRRPLVDVRLIARRHDGDLQPLIAQHHLQTVGRTLGVGGQDHAVAVGQQPLQLRHEARRIAHHRCPAHRLDDRGGGSLGRRRHRPHRRRSVGEQPVEREVQTWECSSCGEHRAGLVRTPRHRQRACERGLLVEQIGGPITHAAGLDQHDERVGRDEVHEDVLAVGQPRQPRLHPVEHETLCKPVPLIPTPRLGGHHRLGPSANLGRGAQLSATEQLDFDDVLGGALILHAELTEPVDLVAPEVDAHGDLCRRGEHVDDRAAHGDLSAVLDLVLPAVPEAHQFGDERFGVKLLPGPNDNGGGLLDMRTEALQHRLHRNHERSRSTRLRPQVPHRSKPTTHRLNAWADPLERQRLPRREDVDLVITKVRAHIVRDALGVSRRGRDDHDRATTGDSCQRGEDEGPGRLRHRQQRAPRPEQIGQVAIAAQQGGKGRQGHLARVPEAGVNAGPGRRASHPDRLVGDAALGPHLHTDPPQDDLPDRGRHRGDDNGGGLRRQRGRRGRGRLRRR